MDGEAVTAPPPDSVSLSMACRWQALPGPVGRDPDWSIHRGEGLVLLSLFVISILQLHDLGWRVPKLDERYDSVIKNPSASADVASILGLGRFTGVGNGNPLQYSCLENSMDKGAWWATVHGIAKSQTWLSMHTHMNLYIQEDEQTPSRINTRRSTSRYIFIKISKGKGRILLKKTLGEKTHIKYKGSLARLTAKFLPDTLEPKRQWDDICKVLREENSQPSIHYQAKLPFKNMKTRLRHSQINKCWDCSS